jgi:transcriptional regulator with XRE-family HTH domain
VPVAPSIEQICTRVAEVLREERLRQNLSMTRLAEGAALSRQGVSLIERGERVPSLDTLLRIARVLKIDAAEVLRRAGSNR